MLVFDTVKWHKKVIRREKGCGESGGRMHMDPSKVEHGQSTESVTKKEKK